MAERIAVHRARRGLAWKTLEAPRDLAGAFAAHAGTPLLVDCLTLWLSNALLAGADIDAEIERLDSAVARPVSAAVSAMHRGYSISGLPRAQIAFSSSSPDCRSP